MNAAPRAPRDRRYSTLAWRRVRDQVRERDGRTCQACGRREPERARRTFPVDHRNPGGDFFDPAGLWLLCWSCNTSKSGMSVEEWRVRAARPVSGPGLYPRTTGIPASSYPPSRSRSLEQAAALPIVASDPDHAHGPWSGLFYSLRGQGSYHACPESCPAPVRWPVTI